MPAGTTTKQTNEELQTICDDLSFRPFGQARWEIIIDDDEMSEELVTVVLEHWVTHRVLVKFHDGKGE